MHIEKMKELFRQWLQEKNFLVLKEEMSRIPVQDVAEILNHLDAKNSLLAFRLLPKDRAAEVFSYLSDKIRVAFSRMIEEDELKSLVEDLFFDDKIDFLEEMPANVVKKILQRTPESERRLINQFLNYPEDSAGSIMTIEFVDLKADMTASQALTHIRYTAPKKETIYTCYVIDQERHLLGVVSLKDLVMADPGTRIEDLMDKQVIAVKTYDDQEFVSSLFKKYDLLSMPVVDQENRLVGIITIDDVMDVLEAENTEDIQRMGGISPTEESYISQSPFTMAKNRLFWLMALMISATFTGRIIQKFEDFLHDVVILAAFIPMLMDTGGNAGSQSSTMVIRGLALDEIKTRDVFRVVAKEFMVSIIVGLSLAGLNFLRLVVIEQVSTTIALVVSLTLVVTVIMAKIVGGLLPLLAKMAKIDPAIMASPLITTIVDAMALVVYFYIAGLFIKI
ncbi:magnesium transporter [Thermoanaerobacter mathranii subsp. mathranii str. A3]|uniref:Magnesium transporter MgtE n=1 Tax=Thermoanaerobacter mathranii subsp. mathranii (strain DSM 11426 / CCUG 53645 / CIP 108742 / A3) TaxID=583358 RepID=A0ABM5LNY4_THEM3|nr:magnesium transporter [Thermoanaerobacter mathranii]ADH60453.1 magnesium transporter [Thermoanaerobacter mathranii subsp. mathranii str. A3]